MIPAIVAGHYGQKYINDLNVPRRLGNALADLALDAYSFGTRFTMHSQLELPITGMTGRTREQQLFDREYIGLLLSWVGLAVDMIDADLKFGETKSSERYATAITEIDAVITNRVHKVCTYESDAYLQKCFSRYWPTAEAIGPDFQLIDYQFAVFADNLASGGVIIDREKLLFSLGDVYLKVQPRLDALVDEYRTTLVEYCTQA